MASPAYLVAPGATVYLSAVFSDQAGVVHPLSALPVATETTNTLVIAPVSTTGNPPAIGDASFCWSIQAPAGASGEFDVNLAGTNPDGTVDAQDVTFTVAADDTQVVTSVSNTPPVPAAPASGKAPATAGKPGKPAH